MSAGRTSLVTLKITYTTAHTVYPEFRRSRYARCTILKWLFVSVRFLFNEIYFFTLPIVTRRVLIAEKFETTDVRF